MIHYRPMMRGDILAGLSLCRAAGWNQVAEDWELFLNLSPQGCCVAVDESGQVRGTVATARYADHFAWIGMVLVDPAYQRRGIGVQLLRESLNILRDQDTIKLDATPAGRHIYRQLEFIDEYRLARMELTRVPDKLDVDPSVRPIVSSDLPLLEEIDHNVFGAHRQSVLRSILDRGSGFAFLLQGNNGVNAYCFGRRGHDFSHIGPVIANDHRSAQRVVSAALKNSHGKPVILDSPVHSPDWLAWLASIGFIEQRPLIRMYRGANAYPGVPEKQFAILGPEFG